MPRALLLSYHYPPSNTAGAHRWGAFTRVGIDRGWTFDVVSCASNGLDVDYTEIERASKEASPASLRVFRVPDREHLSGRMALQIGKTMQSLRRSAEHNASNGDGGAAASIAQQTFRREEIPSFPRSLEDVRRGARAWFTHSDTLSWMNSAENVGVTLGKNSKYEVVISSGPPHMSAEAARKIASALRVPLVLDFRDPWSALDMLPNDRASPVYYALSSHYEARCVAAAELVVMNTKPAAERMRERYPAKHFEVVRNGYDGQNMEPRHDPEQFVIAFAGVIYLDRDPRPLLAGLGLAVKRLGIPADRLQMVFIGERQDFGGVPISQLAAAQGLVGHVHVKPAMPRVELHAELARAALLVNLPQGARLCIPSKVYEYMYFSAWMLALETSDTATGQLLASTQADVVRPDDVAGIERVLGARYTQYMSGERPSPLAVGDLFRVERQAHKFFDLVDPVAAAL